MPNGSHTDLLIPSTATGSDETQYNALQIGSGGVVYAEKNYFFRTNRSIQVGGDSPGDARSFYENANLYDQTTGVSAKRDAFSVAPVSYMYRARIASSVLQAVQTFGPR